MLEQDGRTLERDVERLMRVPSYRVRPRGGGRRGECEGGGGKSRRMHVGEEWMCVVNVCGECVCVRV